MVQFKQNNPLTGLPEPAQTDWANTQARSIPHQTGIAGAELKEAIARFNQLPCEKVIKGKNDAFIVLGRDRTGTALQGKGMQGEAKSSAIDIVVGRWGGAIPEADENNENLYLDPEFHEDAARIYISQNTDIDKSFGLADGEVGHYTDRSAIALKADGIRLISREGIKLVTKNVPDIDEKNSKGLPLVPQFGIDLIANNNDEDLQPLVKGRNLVLGLKSLTQHIHDLNNIVKNFLLFQMKFNKAVQDHVHVSPFWGTDTAPSSNLSMFDGPLNMKNLQEIVDEDTKKFKRNLIGFEMKYLKDSGKKYINSEYNNTN
jgi:hypothetical protein